MKKGKKTSVNIPEEIKMAIAVTLVAVIILIGGNSMGLFEKTEKATEAVVSSTQQTTVTTTAPTTAPTTVPAAPAPTGTTAPAVSGDTQTTTSAQSGTMTTEEIVKIFNESANKVKTDAVKVVKNYEDRTHNEEYLQVPSVIEGMAADLIEENFKDDTEPIEYLTREEIVSQYQVPGVEWASTLTAADVASATCNDNGTEYEITITLHPTENPEPGQGVARAFDTITSSEVMEKAPSFVNEFSTLYQDCTVKCRIDKATGRTVWSNYTSTVILKVNLEFLGSHNAQVGMTFEKDYTITY